MTFKEKILQIIAAKHIRSISAFERMAGLSNGSINKMNNPTQETIEKILKCFPDINNNWLLFDKGKMFITIEPISKEKIEVFEEILEHYPDVNREWLYTGKGKRFKSNDDDSINMQTTNEPQEFCDNNDLILKIKELEKENEILKNKLSDKEKLAKAQEEIIDLLKKQKG